MRMNGEVSEREEKIFDHRFTHILKVMLCMDEKMRRELNNNVEHAQANAA